MCKKMTVIAGARGVGKTSLLGILRGENIDLGEIIETTLEESEVSEKIKTAVESGYYIKLYYIALDTAEESIRRLERRDGKHIEPDTIVNSFNNRFESLKEVLPYCDEMLFFNNENGFEMVGKYKKGRKNNGKEIERRKDICCRRS